MDSEDSSSKPSNRQYNRLPVPELRPWGIKKYQETFGDVSRHCRAINDGCCTPPHCSFCYYAVL